MGAWTDADVADAADVRRGWSSPTSGCSSAISVACVAALVWRYRRVATA